MLLLGPFHYRATYALVTEFDNLVYCALRLVDPKFVRVCSYQARLGLLTQLSSRGRDVTMAQRGTSLCLYAARLFSFAYSQHFKADQNCEVIRRQTDN